MTSWSRGLPDPRVYLKLDTQGYDLRVLPRGGRPAIDRCSLGLQSEVSCVPIYDGMPRLVGAADRPYEEAGFSLTGMFPVTIDRRSLRVIEFDAVLIRVDALPGDRG